MDGKIAKAVVKRTTALTRLQEVHKIAIVAKTDESKRTLLDVYHEDLASMYEAFSAAHNSILGLISDDDGVFKEHDAIRKQGDDMYYQIKSIYVTLKRAQVVDQPLRPVQPVTQAPKLPKVSIPVFDGNLKLWATFCDLFDSIVHNNAQLSNIEKFHYLVTSLVKEPLSIVSTTAMTDNNYPIAYNALIKRYQNQRHLATLYYNEIYNAPSISKPSAKDLRRLLNVFSENLAALSALQLPVEQWDFLLFNLLLNKIDLKTKTEFEIKFTKVEFPSYKQLYQFLEGQCKALESVQALSLTANQNFNSIVNPQTQKFKYNKQTSSFSASQADVSQLKNCTLCNAKHQLYRCPIFISKDVNERFSIVKANKLCVNCFAENHVVASCKSKYTCRTCHAMHHSLLHRDTCKPDDANIVSESSNASTSKLVLSATHINRSNFTVMLSTAIVEVRDAHGSYQKARVLFDSGSMANFISHECLRRLGLPHNRLSMSIECLDNSSPGTRGITRCFIKPKNLTLPSFDVEVIVLSKICSNQPKVNVDLSQLTHVQNLKLADDSCHLPGPIDILIGAEIMPYMFTGGQIFGTKDQPVAYDTVFGWVLQGRAPGSETNPTTLLSLHASIGSVPLELILQKFWEVDSVPNKVHVSQEDAKCEEIYQSTTTRDATGRFIVSLPFRSQPTSFGDTYSQALRRLLMLEKRLSFKPKLHIEYNAFMQNYLDKNYMSLIDPEKKHASNAYYLPHHCVIKPESTTTRLRVVFDASAKGTAGYSLNDMLLTGPKLQTDIVSVLLNFRIHKIGFTCDIRQMYLQIKIASDHHDYQRILWRFSYQEPVQEYCLNTVTFGVSSSPYLALRTIAELADQEKFRFPAAARVLQFQIYVDDIVTGADDLETALALKDELISILATAGFELSKWFSNDKRLLGEVSTHIETSVSFDNEEPRFSKVLGLRWNTDPDVFTYTCNTRVSSCTKRSILSEVARIYDPLGFLSPVTLFAKQLLQQLWSSKCQWDDKPSQKICDIWNTYKAELPLLCNVSVPRYMLSIERTRVDLHGFSDASQSGYGGVVYVRLECFDGSVSTFLCISKSKVAPVKTVSIPRLELLGAVLLANLISKVSKTESLKIDNIFAWTDSEIVLTWLSTHPSRWRTFVANRVAQVQELLPSTVWRYVPSGDNPADCASRGLFPSELCQHTLWWQGPPWLLTSNWPNSPVIDANKGDVTSEEAKTVLNVSIQDNIFVNLLERFSSLHKLQVILAYVLRFCSTLQHKNRLSGPISLAEKEQSLKLLIKYQQSECFDDVLIALRKQRPVPKPYRRLSLFLDDQGLLRVGGRLRNSQLPFEGKHPLLLSGNHIVTDRIILDTHQKHLHPGLKTLSCLLIQQFWILSSRRALHRCLSKCYRCFRANPKSITPYMGELPPCRVNQIRAFQSVCLDYAGPYSVTPGRGRGLKARKAYACVFVCCATKAIHLELAPNLSSEAFLCCFQRFISRRGECRVIYSDQGTNFVGANRTLLELASQTASKLNISWKINPPAAPHFNGLAEAGVKSMKSHLTRVIGSQTLSYDEFNTLLVRVEAVLNSRPLCPISSDPTDLLPLTPAHFLILEPLGSDFPEPDLSHVPENRLNRFQLLSQMLAHFWKRWHNEYLHTLQQRSKWTKVDETSIAVDTLVLVKQENLPPYRWALARVISVHPGSDGIIRVATVRTASGVVERPLVKLCPLPNC